MTAKLKFDVAGMNLTDAVERISWRLDPVWPVTYKTERVYEIAVLNADKIVLDLPTSDIIKDMSKANPSNAVTAALAIVVMMFATFLIVRKLNGFTGNIRVEDDPNSVKDFENVDLNTVPKQYEAMKQDIADTEGVIGEIERSVKSTLTETLTPLFSNLSASVSSVKADATALRTDTTALRTDMTGINAKLDKLLNK